MSTNRLSEVNLVKWDCTTQCVLYMCMCGLWHCVLHQCLVEKFSNKLGDSEKVQNVSDRQQHAGQKPMALFINAEYAQKGALLLFNAQ